MFALFTVCWSVTRWTCWTTCKANAGLFEFTKCIRNLNSNLTLTLWYCICCSVKITVIPLSPQLFYQFSEVYTILWNRRNKPQQEDKQKTICALVRKKSEWAEDQGKEIEEWIWNERHKNFSDKINVKIYSKICFIEGTGLNNQHKTPEGGIRTEGKLGRKK